MNVLLSIKPKYVEKIAKGEKKYEFRKTRFDEKRINKIYIYSSSPVKKIIGIMYVNEIIEDHPKKLWNICNKYSGISKEEYFDYFGNRTKGFALSIENFEPFPEPFDPYINIKNFVPPQSFCYIEKEKISI